MKIIHITIRIASYVILPFLVSTGLVSCRKFIQVDPPITQLVSATVFTSDISASAAVTAIYINTISTINGLASGGLTLYAGLSADEFVNYSTSSDQAQFYKNTLTSANSNNNNLWSEAYNRIYAANAVIEGLANSSQVTDATKKQLVGEAKFIRAFFYFYLVNLYGDVPLTTTTNYKSNASIPRSSQSAVYQQIIADLTDAGSLLEADYSYSGGERVRPNKRAAAALLARVYLYTHDWKDAETQATAVINNTALYRLVTDLDSVFLKNSSEAIWQLMPVGTQVNTNEGEAFILTTTPNSQAISRQLLNSFEPGDNRVQKWISSIVAGGQTYYYPYKYKIKTGLPVTEYYMVMRLAEQYLVRAEARAEQNNINGAQADLNIIRNRAGLPNTTASTQATLLTAIQQERQAELFCEWGNRWLDLKRTGRADAILAPVKASWNASDTLYPIPLAQIQNDPNITQNPGY